jgi:hypothetical protein
MYGNSPLADEGMDAEALSDVQCRRLERDLSRVAARTRELLPGEFVVGSDLAEGANGPEATVAVQPPVGSVVSAGYTLENGDFESGIEEQERADLAQGLAASAALQVKQILGNQNRPSAR